MMLFLKILNRKYSRQRRSKSTRGLYWSCITVYIYIS